MYEPWQMNRAPILRLVLMAAMVAAIGNPGGASAAERYLAGADDLPLMTGLAPLAGRDTIFDSPAGRIIEVYAEGPLTRDRVMSFYAATLPQLGWQVVGDGVFRREGELLRLEFPSRSARPAATTLTVRFYLSPG